MCQRCSYSVVFSILMVALLVGCDMRANPALLLPATPSPAQSGTVNPCGEYGETTITKVVGPLASPQPANILLQLAWEGGFTPPELAFVYGRVPDFTLLADGRAFYQVQDDPSLSDRGQVMVVQLTPAETQELVQRVLDLGFERLESYTDSCNPLPDGSCICVADAGESVLRLRFANGELREVRNYYDFANDPEALAAIRALLEGYRHPNAEPYVPERAALFVQHVTPSNDLAVRDWPLNPAWLAGVSTVQCQIVASRSDIGVLLSVTERNVGDFYFRVGDQVYGVYLVSWLPGVDYTELIANTGQACPSP